jgi:hypothetical protein
MIEENTGNPTPTDAQAEEGVFGSGDSFFNALDNEVNGVVTDDIEPQGEVQATREPEVNQATQPQADPVATDGTDWEKRYKDSSREAQRLNSELRELEGVKPLVNFMKRDSGLVDTIRNYLQNGGETPASVQNQLNLSEDFIFDGHEAVTDANSESAKVLNQMVDATVQKRVGNILSKEKAEAAQKTKVNQNFAEAKEFMTKHSMSEGDFKEMVTGAKNRKFTYEDMYYLLNRDTVAQNVANSTKNEMLGQMQEARSIPTSQGGTNSTPQPAKTADDDIFDKLSSSDGGLSDLF